MSTDRIARFKTDAADDNDNDDDDDDDDDDSDGDGDDDDGTNEKNNAQSVGTKHCWNVLCRCRGTSVVMMAMTTMTRETTSLTKTRTKTKQSKEKRAEVQKERKKERKKEQRMELASWLVGRSEKQRR